MIKSEMGKVKISGPADIVFAEFTSVIRATYDVLKDNFDDETARIIIVKAGELAFAEDLDDEVPKGFARELYALFGVEEDEENEVH